MEFNFLIIFFFFPLFFLIRQENLKLQLYLEELPTSEEYKSAKNEVKNNIFY